MFITSDKCKVCADAESLIGKFSNSFFRINAKDKEKLGIAKKCFSEQITAYVPQFICPFNNKVKTGKISEQELKDFVADCK